MAQVFHYIYYVNARTTWWDTWWLGHRTLKTPLDLWVYQEILHELRPDLIIETGTARGGSALYLASICDLIGTGRVVTIDLKDWPGRPTHPRIRYLRGSSTDPRIVEVVSEHADKANTVVVILDSDHVADHVAKELEFYAPFVSPGSYVIVEDTNLNGHPIKRSHGPGPMEAVDSYLKGHAEFSLDRSREKFLFTFNPKGYLKRAADLASAPPVPPT